MMKNFNNISYLFKFCQKNDIYVFIDGGKNIYSSSTLPDRVMIGFYNRKNKKSNKVIVNIDDLRSARYPERFMDLRVREGLDTVLKEEE